MYYKITLSAALAAFALVIAFSAQVFAAEAVCGLKGGQVENGNKVYQGTCVACHGEDGRGGAVPGVPNFTKKGGVLGKSHAVLIDHIKNGFSSGNSPIAMPRDGGNPDLTDQDLLDVHAYLHKNFGCG